MAVTWAPRILTLLVWALGAWSLTYWVLQFQSGPTLQLPVATATPALPAAEPIGAARLFGPPIEPPAPVVPQVAQSAPVPVVVVDPASRFLLTGVVADPNRQGVALLSVEGRPARPYRVGSRIEDSYTLRSVTAREAVLVDRSTGKRFTVPLATPGGIATAPAAAPANLPVQPGAAPAPGAPAASTQPPAGLAPPIRPLPAMPVPRFGPLPAASAMRRGT